MDLKGLLIKGRNLEPVNFSGYGWGCDFDDQRFTVELSTVIWVSIIRMSNDNYYLACLNNDAKYNYGNYKY